MKKLETDGRRHLSREAWLGGLISLVLVAMLTSWLMPQILPDSFYYEGPMVADSPVKAGQNLTLRLTRCNRESTPLAYSFAAYFRNTDTNQIYAIPAGTSAIRPGCEKVVSSGAVVPAFATPGPYVEEGVVHVQGRWRTSDISFRTLPFVVIPAS